MGGQGVLPPSRVLPTPVPEAACPRRAALLAYEGPETLMMCLLLLLLLVHRLPGLVFVLSLVCEVFRALPGSESTRMEVPT